MFCEEETLGLCSLELSRTILLVSRVEGPIILRPACRAKRDYLGSHEMLALRGMQASTDVASRLADLVHSRN